MFIIRSTHVAHCVPNATRAIACVRELEGAGHDVTVTDAAGRRLNAADLRLIVLAAAGAPRGGP